jgi:ADP-heptose:LPS heptosyltransferase
VTTKGRDLLVAAPERWDEACFAVPAVRALVATGMGIGVLCPEPQREFWQTLAGLEVRAIPAKTKASAVAAAIRGSWQAALLWEPGMAAEAVQLAAVPRRLGTAQRKLNKSLTQSLDLTEKPMEHRVRYYLSVLEAMGIHTLNPEFFAPADIGRTAVAEAVLISPDSDFGPSHEWLLDRWLEVANRLIQSGRRVTVAGLDGGRGCGKALAQTLGGSAEFWQASPLAGALPRLASHGRVIAADGSLPHLAAHAGATCVTLFGPNDPVWKRPLGKRHAVVRRHVECAPCLLGKCPLDGRCQRELEADRVWAAIEAITGNGVEACREEKIG